jgi:xanthine dehydrogenase small subunit
MPAYFRPRTLQEALQVRADRETVVLAGGTDIYPAKTARAAWGDMRHPDVLDISAVDELRGIGETGEHLRFGALTTWAELRRAVLPPAFAGYQAASREIGGPQVQNRGTLVGNICTASPAGDGLPCLLTLDAEVELASLGGIRVMPVAEFVDGYRHTLCRPDEIVLAIRVRKPEASAQGRFVKLGARRYLVISIVMAAATISTDADGTVGQARIAVGACSPVARRLPALEAELVGRPLRDMAATAAAEHLKPLAPIDDIRATETYRRSAALQVVRDLLTQFAAGGQRRVA